MLHALLTFSILGAGEPSLPIAVEVDPSLATIASMEDIRQAVGRELAAPVSAPDSTEPTRGRLEVRRVEVARAQLVWRDADGREVTRQVDLAADGSAPGVIALLTGTLARNEVDALISDRGVTTTTAEVTDVLPAVEPPPAFHRFVLGIETYVSTVNAGITSNVFGLAGIKASYRITPWLMLGLTTSVTADNWRWAISTAPFGEVSVRWSWLQPFAQLGALSQVRFGNGLKAAGGLAPFVGVGARIWLGGRFTIGGGARLYAVATDFLQLINQLLPQQAVILTGGLEVGVSL